MNFEKIFFVLLFACSIITLKAKETPDYDDLLQKITKLATQNVENFTILIFAKKSSMEISDNIHSIVNKINTSNALEEYYIDVRTDFSNNYCDVIELVVCRQCLYERTLTNDPSKWYNQKAKQTLSEDFFTENGNDLIGKIESIERTLLIPLCNIILILVHPNYHKNLSVLQ